MSYRSFGMAFLKAIRTAFSLWKFTNFKLFPKIFFAYSMAFSSWS